jgi:phosphohistidine swiveling domain-containing protein
MKLEKVLEKLEELLRGWGLTYKDWVLTGERAWALQSYKISARKAHIDIFVNRKKWPWKTQPEDISTFPSPKSIQFLQLKEFIVKTKFSPHFLPVPLKLKYHPIEELRKNSKFYILANKKKIRIHKISEDFKDRIKTLLKEDLSNWKEETVKRWFKNFEQVKRIAERKKDREMIKILNQGLEKLVEIQREFKPKLIRKPFLKISQIKGVIAYPGKVKGKTQPILDSKNLSKFKKGNILVTKMTNPEFILAIEKAKAIVTDEGGTGCHAAVISREFKIPCIVGTKIATKVLKDGDLIEVNANQGIVKILKKGK